MCLERTQEVAKRTERLAGGPVTGSKGFSDPMTRTPDAAYPVLGGKVLKAPTLDADAAEFVAPASG